MKGILLLILHVKISFQQHDICKDLQEQWRVSNCDNSTQQKGICYFYGSQKIKIAFLTSTIIVNCNRESPEVHILNCLPYANAVTILYMVDCSFRSFNMKDLLLNSSISKIYLNYTESKMASSNINLTFSGLNKLRNITIEGSRTVSPFGVRFYFLPNLISLNIINSNFTTLYPAPFKDLFSLQELSMQKGLIQSVPQTLFTALFNLRILDLRFNHIKSIEPNSFANLTLLHKLYLSHNQLVVINTITFSNLVNLHELDISFNPIIRFPNVMPFGPSKRLSIVKVTNCKLEELPKINWLHHTLTLLDFSNNLIKKVTLVIFSEKRTEVILRDNAIETIIVDFKEWYFSSPSYYIGNNRLVCNCNLEKFLQFLHSDIQQIRRIIADAASERCNSPTSIPIMKAWPEYIICPITDCPTDCNCSRNNEGYVEIECNGKHLLHPPSIIPFGTTAIYLQNNCISSLSTIDTYTWQKVTQLYLSGNLLKSLEENFIPGSVTTLDVSRNHLTDIPSSLKETIGTAIDYNIFLANNKWICECESTELFNWFFNNYDKILDFHQIFCTKSGSKERLLILDLQIHLLCEGLLAAPVVVILMFVAALSVLLLVATSYYYRKDIYAILYYFHSHICAVCFTKRMEYGKRFDVFLVYHEEDWDYANTIIHELQTDNQFCTCVYNSIPNEIIECNILFSFMNSRKTVFLVSKTLMECNKFKEDFFQIYHNEMENRIYKFVIIIIGKISDIIDLECGHHIFFLNKTILKWKDKLFWKKLNYYVRPTLEKDDVFTEVPLV